MNGFDSYRLGERARAARWVVAGAFLVLLGAFFRTQIIQHEKFQLKAETNRLRPIALTAASRYDLDRHGQIIAENVPGYSVKLLAPSADSLRPVLARVARWLPLDSAGDRRHPPALRRVRDTSRWWCSATPPSRPSAKLEEHRVAFPGLVIQAEPKRLYPARKGGRPHGRVCERGDRRRSRARPIPGARAGIIVGKAGLEREYDDSLRGTDGVRYIEVNARGRLVRKEGSAASLPPTPGRPIGTTIDLDLQRYIDSIWPAGVRGAMVAMTPTGEIRALYSAPSFDPNAFVGGIPPPL